LTRAGITLGLACLLASLAWAGAQAWPAVLEVPRDAESLEALLTPAIGVACAGEATQVGIAGVGRARFDDVTFDAAAGTGRLDGGVCIELDGLEIRLRVQTVDLAGLNVLEGQLLSPTLETDLAALDFGGWRVWIRSLEGSLDALEFGSTVLVGPGAIGLASGGGVREGVPELHDVALVTDRYLLRARQARFEGDAIALLDVEATTCACLDAPFRLLGDAAAVAWSQAPTLGTIREPRVALAGVTVPLGGTATLGPDGVALDLPVTVRRDDTLGTLLGVRTPNLRPSNVAWGVALQPSLGPWIDATLDGEDRTVRLTADRRGVAGTYREAWGSLAGAKVAGVVTVDLVDGPHLVTAGVEAERGFTGSTPTSAWTFDGTLGTDIGAFLQPTLGDASLVGGYAPLTLDGILRRSAAPNLSVEVQAEAGPVLWTDHRDAPKAAFAARLRVQPSLTFAGEWWEGTLTATRHFVRSVSTLTLFDEEAVARLEGTVRWGDDARGATLDVAWRMPPETVGAERLRARAHVTWPVQGGWTVQTTGEVRMAGLVGGDEEDAYLKAAATASRELGTQVGIDARLALPGGTLTQLAVDMRQPFTFTHEARTVTLTPHLTLDVASTWREVPLLAGHGMQVAVTDCCVTLTAGYEADADGWSIDVGVDLPPFRLAGSPDVALPNVPALYGDDR